MSSKKDLDYIDDDDDDDHDDDDDEDEGDFVPNVDDDDDDLDDDFVDEDDDNDDEDSPILQGSLYKNGSNLLVYESLEGVSPQAFQLVAEACVPASWNLSSSPVLDKPSRMMGWMNDPNQTLTMEIYITRLDPSTTIDPLERRFLESQDVWQSRMLDIASSSSSKSPSRAKAGTEDDDDDDKNDEKFPAAAGNLKEVELDGKMKAGDIFVMTGEQISDDRSAEISRKIRGLFRCPKDNAKLYLMASIQAGTAMAAAAGSSNAKPQPVLPAAAARKRGRGNSDDDDDDGDDGVNYQELIDLHDDAGLSTEELRRRYYGGGAVGSAANGEDGKKKAKPNPKNDDEDDDDDDAYGF